MTDKDYDDRMGYVRGIEQLYRFVEAEAAPQFRDDTSPAATMHAMTRTLQTESRKDRRTRLKRAEAATRQRFLASCPARRGRGYRPGDIAGVLLRSDFLKRAYGGKDADHSVYVLLRDGTAYRNPTRPPSDINIKASRQIEASQWLEWRKSGKGYQVRANATALWKTLKGGLAKPAPGKTLGFAENTSRRGVMCCRGLQAIGQAASR